MKNVKLLFFLFFVSIFFCCWHTVDCFLRALKKILVAECRSTSSGVCKFLRACGESLFFFFVDYCSYFEFVNFYLWAIFVVNVR